MRRQGWLGLGAIGFWVLVVSVLALRANTLPRRLGYVGIVASALSGHRRPEQPFAVPQLFRMFVHG